MIADEERDPTMLHENAPTNSNIKRRGTIEVEIIEIIGCVGFGFVVGVGTVFMIQILSK